MNLATHAKPTAWLAKWAAGMAQQREAPRFAAQTFVSWFHGRSGAAAVSGARERVVLWPDTFNNHFHPDTARAALRVLTACGFEVLVPRQAMCCGRPLYDYGFLDLARTYLERVLDGLEPYLEQGLPIVVLEPSCASVFRDELQALMPGRPAARRLAEQTKLLSELLVEKNITVPKLERKALVQGHCHHKSVLGYDAEQALFERMQLDAELLSSGCCGMAGSFGFEGDPAKQQVSHACGERVLLPAVRHADDQTLIIADGFSCQTQIHAGSPRRGMHVAEVLDLAFHPDRPQHAQRERLPERLAAAGLAAIGLGAWLGLRSLRAFARAG